MLVHFKWLRKIDWAREAQSWIWLGLGILSASLGLKGFLLPNAFLDGGAMGISLLIHRLSGIDLSIWVMLVNFPFILLGLKQVSLNFALRTLISISILAILLEFITFPTLTSDKLLISVFGGFFLGAGIGLAIRGGAVIDGTEILALYLSRRTVLSIGDVITLINILIFSVAAILIRVEIALYAILTYLVASKTIDFIIHGMEGYSSILIISEKSESIRQLITEELERGVTIIKGERGFRQAFQEKIGVDILYTVISRLEVPRLKQEIEKIDPNAFIIQQRIDDSKGGMIKRRRGIH